MTYITQSTLNSISRFTKLLCFPFYFIFQVSRFKLMLSMFSLSLSRHCRTLKRGTTLRPTYSCIKRQCNRTQMQLVHQRTRSVSFIVYDRSYFKRNKNKIEPNETRLDYRVFSIICFLRIYPLFSLTRVGLDPLQVRSFKFECSHRFAVAKYRIADNSKTLIK